MGTFDAEGNYTPRQVTERDLTQSFADAINGTLVELKDGQLVTGTVVRITRDEVLVEIGYKTEGVILGRELSMRADVDPNTIVKLGEKIETLVITLEDKEGRLLLSKKRAQYERAWGDIEKVKEVDGTVEGLVIEVVKGGLIVDIGLRGFLPASLVEMRRVRDLAPYIGQRITAKSLSWIAHVTT
jgi:small subunit ribosomal protein S1